MPGAPRETVEGLFRRLEQLNDIGAALSQQTSLDALLEKILIAAQTITRADGGTLYLLEEECLRFAIVRNSSLNIAMGGTTANTKHTASRRHKPSGTGRRRFIIRDSSVGC